MFLPQLKKKRKEKEGAKCQRKDKKYKKRMLGNLLYSSHFSPCVKVLRKCIAQEETSKDSENVDIRR